MQRPQEGVRVSGSALSDQVLRWNDEQLAEGESSFRGLGTETSNRQWVSGAAAQGRSRSQVNPRKPLQDVFAKIKYKSSS